MSVRRLSNSHIKPQEASFHVSAEKNFPLRNPPSTKSDIRKSVFSKRDSEQDADSSGRMRVPIKVRLNKRSKKKISFKRDSRLC
jgi:hypothetical protein